MASTQRKTKTQHIHKYKLVKLFPRAYHKVYKCMQPGCTHYTQPSLIENAISICWGCDEPFVVKGNAKDRKYPKCIKCVEKSTRGNPRFKTTKPKRVFDVNSPTKLSRLALELDNALLRDSEAEDE